MRGLNTAIGRAFRAHLLEPAFSRRDRRPVRRTRAFCKRGLHQGQGQPHTNEDTCITEFDEFDATGDSSLGEKEVKAAIDAIPTQLAKALEAVDIEKGCVGEQVRRIVQEVQEGKRRLNSQTGLAVVRPPPPSLPLHLLQARYP